MAAGELTVDDRKTRTTVPSPERITFTVRKATVMTTIVFAMIIILAVAATIVGLVAVGLQGRGRDRAPRLAEKMTHAAEHLNGDSEPPEKFVPLVETRLLH